LLVPVLGASRSDAVTERANTLDGLKRARELAALLAG
jgi:hypothetical protein